MAMELIHLRVDKYTLKRLDDKVSNERYPSRAELIREILRKEINRW